VAQGVGPVFKPQYRKKKKKRHKMCVDFMIFRRNNQVFLEKNIGVTDRSIG
jgi:hypothetical protein